MTPASHSLFIAFYCLPFFRFYVHLIDSLQRHLYKTHGLETNANEETFKKKFDVLMVNKARRVPGYSCCCYSLCNLYSQVANTINLVADCGFTMVVARPASGTSACFRRRPSTSSINWKKWLNTGICNQVPIETLRS